MSRSWTARSRSARQTWLGLAEQGIVELIASTPAMVSGGDGWTSAKVKHNQASLDEYRQVRGSFSKPP